MKLLFAPLLFSPLIYLVYYFLQGLFHVNENKSLSLSGFIFEQIILFCILLIFYAVVKRKRLAVLLTLIFYLCFLLATIIKVKVLGAPIFPNDLLLMGDLLRTWGVVLEYIPYLILLLCMIFAVCYYEIKNTAKEKVYGTGILVFLVVIVGYLTMFQNENTRLFLRDHGIYLKKNVNLVKKGFVNGYLSSFVQATFFLGKPSPPEHYSKDAVDTIINRYQLLDPIGQSAEADNVIVLLVESFTRPEQFGWKIQPSPTPNFDKITYNHASGIAISPVYGGKSINAEFEVMTGLSNRFTPIETTPYQEFVDKNIPSLARSFKVNGYTTNAVQMIPFEGFGYGRIYDYIGVDNKFSLTTEKLDADPSGRSVASHEISKKILKIINEQEKSFVFAFPNSSHQPWKLEHYPKSNLKITDSKLRPQEEDKLLAYANALNHVDKLFGDLIESLKNSDEKTLVLIVGDHQPGIDFYNQHLKNKNNNEYVDLVLSKYQTALAIWSNYLTEKNDNIELSMNMIPALIIELSGVRVDGMMKFLIRLKEQFSVISHLYKKQGGGFSNKVSEDAKQIIKDYKLLQYDILFGKNYLYKTMMKDTN